MEKIYRINLNVKDQKGAIATLATILASHDINLKNIGIQHNRENTNGVLSIEFYDETSAKEAKKVLSTYNYAIVDEL